MEADEARTAHAALKRATGSLADDASERERGLVAAWAAKHADANATSLAAQQASGAVFYEVWDSVM